MEKKCERCGAGPKGEYDLLDYCAHCSRDLCDECMEKGCCGHVPAESGAEIDNDDQDAWETAQLEHEANNPPHKC